MCGRQGAHRMRRRRSSLCSVSSRMPSAMRSALVTAAGNRCIKRERSYPPMHSHKARPKARTEYMKRQRALSGASSLQCRSVQEILVVFCENDLSALMLTLGVADFSPPHQSSAVSAPSLPPQNATNYTTLPANKKPPPKITGEGVYKIVYGLTLHLCSQLLSPVFSNSLSVYMTTAR